MQSMGNHISDYASALVTPHKAVNVSGATIPGKLAAGRQDQVSSAKQLAQTTQTAQPSFDVQMSDRHTEQAPTAASIRQGIMQVSKIWTSVLLVHIHSLQPQAGMLCVLSTASPNLAA